MRTILLLFLITACLSTQSVVGQNKPAAKAPSAVPGQKNERPGSAGTEIKTGGTDAKAPQNAAGTNAKEPAKLAVPVNVLETFYAKYQKTKEVIWKQVEKEFVVNFKLGEHPLEATFAADGQWLHTTQNISVNQLPRDIIVRIGKQPALKMKTAKKAESYQRGVVYEVTVLKDGQSLPLVFLPNGRLVSGEWL